MSKKSPKTKTNGAAHAKPQKPAPDETEAPEAAEAGDDAAAADSAGDEEGTVETVCAAIFAELRKDPEISWVEEHLIAKMMREQRASKSIVETSLDLLTQDDKIACDYTGGVGSVKLLVDDGDDGEGEGDDDDDDDDDDSEPASSRDVHEYHPTRNLEHIFTEAEVHEMRIAVEKHHEEADRLQKLIDDQAEKLKSLKRRYETAIEDALSTSRRIRQGSEWQDIACEERREADSRVDEPTYGKTMMVTYRLDTNEPIEWRELNFKERQGVLWNDAPAPTPAGNGVEVRG
jgi:hypothetical protein